MFVGPGALCNKIGHSLHNAKLDSQASYFFRAGIQYLAAWCSVDDDPTVRDQRLKEVGDGGVVACSPHCNC